MEVTPIKREKLYSLILATLNGSEGMTAREVSINLFAQGYIFTPTRQEVAPRCTELVEKGKLEVCGSKIDESTCKRVSIYKLAE